LPESLEWGFRPEIGAADVPDASADVDEIHRFANTLDGYRVWGDDRAVAAVSEQTMTRVRARAPCTSILKLRTALFWQARAARRTDEVGPSLMPEEAMFEPEMRAPLAQLRDCIGTSPVDLKLFAQALEATAAAIPTEGRFVESDLRDGMIRELADLADALPNDPLAAAEVNMGQLPGWDPSDPPGKFDVAWGPGDRDRLKREATLLAEVKWSDHNTLSHSLWDAAKLVAGLRSCADHVILVSALSPGRRGLCRTCRTPRRMAITASAKPRPRSRASARIARRPTRHRLDPTPRRALGAAGRDHRASGGWVALAESRPDPRSDPARGPRPPGVGAAGVAYVGTAPILHADAGVSLSVSPKRPHATRNGRGSRLGHAREAVLWWLRE